MKFRLAATVAFVLSLQGASAQQFGGFPPLYRWQQIHTDTARVIFTPAAAVQAQRIAALLHRMAATEQQLGNRLQPISMVLHPNTTLANGYVALAPFRSELYLVPPSNIFEFGNLPWSDQLVVHEYRHVQQYNQFNHGLSRVAGFLLGQEARALANAASVPDWFFEGDAVYAETKLTPQGRGRQPYFFNSFNALWKEGRNYSWMKLRNGSYRDQVPDHYPLGYLLVNYGYQKYGPDFWRKVTQDASAFKGLFYPFQRAVKRYSGIPYRQFRNEALASYQHEVSRRRDQQGHREVVTDYLFPRVVGTDSLLYLKSGYQQIPAFFVRQGGTEKRIARRDISSEDWIGYGKGTLAYTAYSTHPRWSLIDYSDIVLLDVASGSRTRITHKQKYFTPSFSPGDSLLVAVHINDSLQCELHILDRQGNVLQRRRTGAGALFVHPQFVNNHTVVVGIRHASARMSLHLLDLQTMTFSQVLPATAATIGYFFPYNGKVYFTASLNGTDDLYELNLLAKTTFRLTTGGVGHYFASVDGNRVTWSEFTSNGFRIRQRSLDSLSRIEIPAGQWGLEQPPFNVAGADSAQNILETPARDFPVKPYPKTTGLLNVHSWRPYYTDPEFTFSIFSDNVLNTFSNELYYRYNQDENSHAVGFSTAYGGFFPVLTAGVEHTFERRFADTTRVYTYSNTDVRAGYYIPLNFTRGTSYKYLRFGTDVVYSVSNPTGASKGFLEGGSSVYLSHSLSWSQLRPRARQQIYPRLGYAVSGNGRHRLDAHGYQVLGNTALYLPGVLRTHSIILTGGVQSTDSVSRIFFSNRFANSRGYSDFYNPLMWKLSANYHLPLLYPEIGAANIVYLSRIRGNAFFDNTRYFNYRHEKVLDLASTGGEVYFDMRWWNEYNVTIGVRYSRLLDAAAGRASSANVWEIVLPVSLLPR
ncbi:TolB family protein [Flaviaesturariibacter terrae]